MTYFIDLLSIHKNLDELFFQHQRALMRLDLENASRILEQYEGELLAHIEDEEQRLMPIYRERVQAPIGGAEEIFLGEHEKLKQHLVLFKEYMADLGPGDDLERRVLFLIDSQHLFKRLLVHHDTRERKILYPLLDQCTDANERESLFSTLTIS
jgi:iron-sulfur cluster repair protein YtfE (RIC family)